MALQGTIRDFGISDIFQLIQQQQKTGVLRLSEKETEVKVMFDGGKIVGAESTGAKQQKEPLGVLLVRGGLVKQEHLDAALVTQQRTLRKLGDILIQDGSISKADLKRFLELQTRETINRLFRWRTGDYEFVPEPVKYDAEVATPLNPEHVLMDGFRMLDEWPAVQKVIHGLEAIPAIPKGVAEIVKRKEKPAAGHEGEEEEEEEDDDEDDDIDAAFAAFEEGDAPKAKAKPAQIKLSVSETIVYDLVDGKRTVQDIVDRSLLGEFNTCQALAGLIEKGAAAIVGRKRVDNKGRIPVVERARGEGMRLAMGVLVSLAVVVVSLVALLVLGLGGRGALSARATAVPRTGTAIDALGEHRARRVQQAAEIHFLRTGRWPKDLPELAATGLVVEEELKDAKGRPLVYLPPAAGELAGRVFRQGP